MAVTQKDFMESVIGLREMSASMRRATEDGPLVEGVNAPSIPVRLSTMLSNAQYLETVADELLQLIPDQPVPTPPKE